MLNLKLLNSYVSLRKNRNRQNSSKYLKQVDSLSSAEKQMEKVSLRNTSVVCDRPESLRSTCADLQAFWSPVRGNRLLILWQISYKLTTLAHFQNSSPETTSKRSKTNQNVVHHQQRLFDRTVQNSGKMQRYMWKWRTCNMTTLVKWPKLARFSSPRREGNHRKTIEETTHQWILKTSFTRSYCNFWHVDVLQDIHVFLHGSINVKDNKDIFC